MFPMQAVLPSDISYFSDKLPVVLSQVLIHVACNNPKLYIKHPVFFPLVRVMINYTKVCRFNRINIMVKVLKLNIFVVFLHHMNIYRILTLQYYCNLTCSLNTNRT